MALVHHLRSKTLFHFFVSYGLDHLFFFTEKRKLIEMTFYEYEQNYVIKPAEGERACMLSGNG